MSNTNSNFGRRTFLGHSARLVGGAIALGTPLAAASRVAASPLLTPSRRRVAAAELGTVRTAVNWVADVEWAAWYLGDANGHFAERGVGIELVHGGPNTPSVAQTSPPATPTSAWRATSSS
jgi:ABC-type nitrate/sulfonate/bicarbonate transport system substrate-binding protein